MPLEELWGHLAETHGSGAQVRVDSVHPCDIYADFQPPSHIGLVVVCDTRPPQVQPMRAISVEQGLRSDGRWALRLALLDNGLRPVFLALCNDIIICTRSGVEGARLGQIVVQRIAHWRELLQRDAAGLGDTVLRGLIGELLILRDRLLPEYGPSAALDSWRGPTGAPQDFLLPDGHRLEVKTVMPHADRVHVNGLAQLDPVGDFLTLIVVRAEAVSPNDSKAITAPEIVNEVRDLLTAEPEALAAFGIALNGLGWHEHESHDEVAIRIVRVDEFEVGPTFPRLTRQTVPPGVLEADYVIALPGIGAISQDENR